MAIEKDEPTVKAHRLVVGGPNGVSADTRDILAIGVVLLAVGAVIVAILVAMGMIQGHITAHDAKPIILGCVGGSAIASVVAAIIRKKDGKAH